MIVLDASAAVELLLGSPQGRAVAAKLTGRDGDVVAPCLLDVEVVRAVRRLERVGTISRARAATAISDLLDLAVDRVPLEPLVHRVWALRHNLSAYDAAYAALAEGLGATLITCDQRLANSSGHNAAVLVP